MRGLNLRQGLALLVLAWGALLGGCGGQTPPPSLSIEGLPSLLESSPNGEAQLDFKLASSTGYEGEVIYRLLEDNQPVSWATLSPEREQVSIRKGERRPTSMKGPFHQSGPYGSEDLVAPGCLPRGPAQGQ